MTEKSLTIKNEELLKISDISDEYWEQLAENKNEFVQMALTAKAVHEIKKLLPDELIKGFKALENTSLGFRTDRPVEGYPLHIIRDCLIEAVMRKVRPIGNEFNIIQEKFYITKEGYQGMMSREKRLQNFKFDLSIPQASDGGKKATVKFTATWIWNGTPDELIGEIPIRVNAGMGDDAILGKSERKIRARVWTRITGVNMPDGDTNDEELRFTHAKPINLEPRVTAKIGVEALKFPLTEEKNQNLL